MAKECVSSVDVRGRIQIPDYIRKRADLKTSCMAYLTRTVKGEEYTLSSEPSKDSVSVEIDARGRVLLMPLDDFSLSSHKLLLVSINKTGRVTLRPHQKRW